MNLLYAQTACNTPKKEENLNTKPSDIINKTDLILQSGFNTADPPDSGEKSTTAGYTSHH